IRTKSYLEFIMTIRSTLSKVLIVLTILTPLALSISAQGISNTWTPIEGDGTLRRIHVPILMYHYIGELPPDADDIRRGLTLHPDIFRQHIEYLADNGYHTVSLYEVDNALENG